MFLVFYLLESRVNCPILAMSSNYNRKRDSQKKVFSSSLQCYNAGNTKEADTCSMTLAIHNIYEKVGDVHTFHYFIAWW